MNGVEAAASLFGSEESSSSDPFAAIVGPEQGANNSAAGDLFSSSSGYAEQDFFSSTSKDQQPLGLTRQDPHGTVGQHNGQESSSHQYGYQGAYSQDTSNLGQDQSQNWYGGQQQWAGQQQQYTAGSGAHPEHGANVYSPEQYQPTSYQQSDPYAPPTTTYSHMTAPSTTSSGYAASSTYDPYAPSAQTSNPPTNSYAPPSHTTTTNTAHSSYDPYSPQSASLASSHYGHHTSQPSYSYSSMTHTPAQAPPTTAPTTSIPAPPPPAPTAALNRTKATNAYDPPFPTSKPRAPRTSAMHTTYSAYGGYQAANATPPPAPVSHSYSPSAYGHNVQAAVPPPPARASTTHSSLSPHPTQGYSSQTTFNTAYTPSDHNRTYDGLPHNEPRNDSPYSTTHWPSQPSTAANHSPSLVKAALSPPRPSQSLSSTHSAASSVPTAGLPAPVSGVGSSQQSGVDAVLPLDDPEGLHDELEGYSNHNDFSQNWSSPLPPTSSSQSLGSHRSATPSSTQKGSSSPELSYLARRAVSPASYLSPSRKASPEIQRRGSPLVPHDSPKKVTRTTAYAPQPFSITDVTTSLTPSLSSSHSAQGPSLEQNNSFSPLLPKFTPSERVLSPELGSTAENGHAQTSYDPYAPKVNGNSGERAASPSLYTSYTSKPPPPDSNVSSAIDTSRQRSMSNGSVLSSVAGAEDPYAPATRRRQTTDSMNPYSMRYNTQPQDAHYTPYGASHEFDSGSTQEVSLRPLQTAYAPSPSLLGANDPLGRTAVRVPVISFGFGGKLVTCFHGADSLSTGFDVALSSKNSTGVHIRPLKSLIPDSALDTSTSEYPGPLFSDPGTPVSSIVRPGTSTQMKNKKSKVIKYLEERAEEFTRAIGYLHAGSPEKRQAEGRLVIVKLLKIMVENDGRLSGSAAIDTAIRTALVPSLEGKLSTTSSDSNLSTFSTMGDVTKSPVLGPVPYPPVSTFGGESSEAPISVSTLRASSLNKIQNFLLRGERRQAYHYALDEKLWGHAMVIASSIDKEAWKEVVSEFLRTELGVKDDSTRSSNLLRPAEPMAYLTNGREPLKVAYSLYSGHGAAAVQELVPQNLLVRAAAGHLVPPANSQLTPRTPNFAAPTPSSNIPQESLARWAETAAMMISNPITPETSSALTALGDQLLAHQWTDAAHACFLLSRQTSPLGGLGNQAARIILLGSRSPQASPGFVKDQDTIIFTEILEFALSLGTPKGAEPFNGVAHFQAYKFLRAMYLAEIGDVQRANRYCEALSASFVRPSPYFTPALLDQLKALTERILGLNSTDKSSSWMSGKISKPSLDTIGGWLEGRFTQLVTGESEPPAQEDQKKADERTFSGPFASISHPPSASPSPAPSLVNHNVPPYRSGSAMANISPYAPPQIDRASSAIDYIKHRPSPGPTAPRIASANAVTTTFAQSHAFAHDSSSGHRESMSSKTTLTTSQEDSTSETGWWTSSSSPGEGQTPTATTFLKVDEGSIATNSEGFISLMDATPFPVAQTTSSHSNGRGNGHSNGNAIDEEEFDEELSLANPKKKEKTAVEKSETPAESSQPVPAKAAEPDQQAQQADSSSGGWFSRWWKREGNAPVKASLGEESSFYYDKDLKKWVNKKAGAEEAKPTPPPPPPPARTPSLPPSRAQTASPGMAMRPPAGGPSFTPPPPPTARPSSAIDLSSSPPKQMTRARSNLVPGSADSAPSTPTGTRSAPPPPPMNRPKSQASKRNVRSRYVDVFQQDGGAS
ncbi:hypothetical protein AX16_003625 [Volvariella volvacea WC 439]|nr:hypothetical protein AX16_003625 [Volvariella volvacea WC 439]